MPEFKEEYKTNANICPVCGSENIDTYYEGVEDTCAFFGCSCDDCDAEWREDYILQFRVNRASDVEDDEVEFE